MRPRQKFNFLNICVYISVDTDESLTSNETSSDSNTTAVLPKVGTHRETLWDIELDKELSESEGNNLFVKYYLQTNI